jgi:hypothetical protein
MCPGEWVGTYIAKAEALIELLEIHDCGSVGAFEPDTGGDSRHGRSTSNNALRLSSASTLRRKRKAEVLNTSAVFGWVESREMVSVRARRSLLNQPSCQ